jgi:hypothetical protein
VPLNRLFRQDAEAADAMQDMYLLELREAIVAKREELEVYETAAWEHVDKVLAVKLEHSFRDMMVGEPEQMILARERARVVSDLRAEPAKLREQIADLQKKLTEAEGDTDG